MTDVLTHLDAARDVTLATLTDLDQTDIELRDALDHLNAERTRNRAFLHDLDQLIAAHATRAVVHPAPTEVEPALGAIKFEATKGTRPTQPGTYDYSAIAGWITAAKTASRYTVVDLAAAFDVPKSTAKNWPGKCQKLGLLALETIVSGGQPAPPTSPARAPSTPVTRPPKVPAKPRQSGVDLVEVARVVNEAQAAGALPIPALCAHFNLHSSTVKNWLKRVRDTGMVNPAPKPNIRVIDEPNTSPPTTVVRPPLTEIADTFREAITDGRKPIQTIIDRYDVDHTIATDWVAQCRATGQLPLRGEPVVPAGDIPHKYVSHRTH